MPGTIGDYYRHAIEGAKQEIEDTAEDRVLGMDADKWVLYLIQKWGMEPIKLDETRQPEMDEVETERALRGYDIYAGRPARAFHRLTEIRVHIPVHPSDTIDVIWKQKLSPNSFSLTVYPEFEYDESRGTFNILTAADAADIKRGIDKIKSGVRSYNESIENEHPTFQRQIGPLVESRRRRVQVKHKGLDDLAAAVGITLRKKVDPATVVPTAPRVKTKIAPILPPASKAPARPVLERDKFEAILEILNNGCRQFERTPAAFQQLAEEGLRDVLLASLNAVFEGAAGGETFRGVGKVDIHLRISQGEVFVAEIKFWEGPESLRTVIKQLLDRLTWRDSYGVALVLSRNAGFTGVLEAIRDVVGRTEGVVAGSVQATSPNHFIARFAIPSDNARQAYVHVLAYNLFVPDPGKRAVKKGASPGN